MEKLGQLKEQSGAPGNSRDIRNIPWRNSSTHTHILKEMKIGMTIGEKVITTLISIPATTTVAATCIRTVTPSH